MDGKEEAMDLHAVRSFLMWCTILNGGLLLLSFFALACAGDLVYRLHGRWFPLTRETFDAVTYCLLGGMKILFFMCNLVPYLALVLIG